LWVGIDGETAIRKLTLTGAVPTVGPLRTLPRGGPSNEPTQIVGMQAIPGSADAVIATLRGATSQVRVGTYVLDDGSPRTDVLAAPSPSSFALGPPGIIFGSADGLDAPNSAIYTMTLSSGGLSTVKTTGFLGGGIRRDGGLLFSSAGEVIDVSSPASPFKAGQLLPLQSLNTSIAVLGRRRLLVVQSDWHGQLGIGRISLSVFETSGFKEIASGFLLFKVPPLVSEIFYLGGDALVALTANGLVLIHAPFLLPP